MAGPQAAAALVLQRRARRHVARGRRPHTEGGISVMFIVWDHYHHYGTTVSHVEYFYGLVGTGRYDPVVVANYSGNAYLEYSA